MKNSDFDKLVERETKRMVDVMCSKSADYADDGDKLFNFKLAAKLDGISPIEALRGMWLKHRTSIRQGLDELVKDGTCRSEDWWIEKFTDDRNYSLLLQALLEEKYFTSNNEPKKVGKFTIKKAQDLHKGWYIILTKRNGPIVKFLHKDLALHPTTGWWPKYEYGEAPGYYNSMDQAITYIVDYNQKLSDVSSSWVVGAENTIHYGWYVYNNDIELCLHKDLTLRSGTGYIEFREKFGREPVLGEASGYWSTKKEAEDALTQYLENQS